MLLGGTSSGINPTSLLLLILELHLSFCNDCSSSGYPGLSTQPHHPQHHPCCTHQSERKWQLNLLPSSLPRTNPPQPNSKPISLPRPHPHEPQIPITHRRQNRRRPILRQRDGRPTPRARQPQTTTIPSHDPTKRAPATNRCPSHQQRAIPATAKPSLAATTHGHARPTPTTRRPHRSRAAVAHSRSSTVGWGQGEQLEDSDRVGFGSRGRSLCEGEG